MKKRRVVFQCEIETEKTARQLQATTAISLLMSGGYVDGARVTFPFGYYPLDERPVITIVKQPKATSARHRPGKTMTQRPKEPIKYGYMCGVDWQHHVGHDPSPVGLYRSMKDLKAKQTCWRECGIVRVRLVFDRWVEPQTI